MVVPGDMVPDEILANLSWTEVSLLFHKMERLLGPWQPIEGSPQEAYSRGTTYGLYSKEHVNPQVIIDDEMVWHAYPPRAASRTFTTMDEAMDYCDQKAIEAGFLLHDWPDAIPVEELREVLPRVEPEWEPWPDPVFVEELDDEYWLAWWDPPVLPELPEPEEEEPEEADPGEVLDEAIEEYLEESSGEDVAAEHDDTSDSDEWVENFEQMLENLGDELEDISDTADPDTNEPEPEPEAEEADEDVGEPEPEDDVPDRAVLEDSREDTTPDPDVEDLPEATAEESDEAEPPEEEPEDQEPVETRRNLEVDPDRPRGVPLYLFENDVPEIARTEAGDIDEIIGVNTYFHLERLNARTFWFIVGETNFFVSPPEGDPGERIEVVRSDDD